MIDTNACSIKDASGRVLVDQEGIKPPIVDDLRRRLDDARTRYARYGETWEERHAEEDDSDYLVEPEVASMGELEALVADYLAKAKRLGYVPMHGWL